MLKPYLHGLTYHILSSIRYLKLMHKLLHAIDDDLEDMHEVLQSDFKHAPGECNTEALAQGSEAGKRLYQQLSLLISAEGCFGRET